MSLVTFSAARAGLASVAATAGGIMAAGAGDVGLTIAFAVAAIVLGWQFYRRYQNPRS
jgi:hypothetical protein